MHRAIAAEVHADARRRARQPRIARLRHRQRSRHVEQHRPHHRHTLADLAHRANRASRDSANWPWSSERRVEHHRMMLAFRSRTRTAPAPDGEGWATPRQAWAVSLTEQAMVVDPLRWELVDDVAALAQELPPSLRCAVTATADGAALEVRTAGHATVSSAIGELRALRGRLTAAVGRAGLRLAVAGSHPGHAPTFALHVGVTIPDAEPGRARPRSRARPSAAAARALGQLAVPAGARDRPGLRAGRRAAGPDRRPRPPRRSRAPGAARHGRPDAALRRRRARGAGPEPRPPGGDAPGAPQRPPRQAGDHRHRPHAGRDARHARDAPRHPARDRPPRARAGRRSWWTPASSTPPRWAA